MPKAAPVLAEGCILTGQERRRLAGLTQCDERTIKRWERGELVRGSTRELLERVARTLKLPVPEAT